jgi:hypothetical protein
MDKFIHFIEVASGIFMIDYTNAPYSEGEYVNSEFVRSKLNNKNIKVRIFDRKNEEVWKNFSENLR